MKTGQTQVRSQAKRKEHHRKVARKKFRAPHTVKQFFARPLVFQDSWAKVTHIVSKMRADRVSLRTASRDFGLDPRVVIRLGKAALRKRKNGQYVAKRSDKLLRILAIPTPDGVREVAIRDSRQATILGKYWAAVAKYLQTGDASALAKFRRKRITDASGKKIVLVPDTATLDQLGSAGVLSFESLYARAM